MRTRVLVLCCLLVGLASWAWAAGDFYYIAPPSSGGNDGNNCPKNSPQTRMATVTKGLSCLSGGDTLVLGNGVYLENIQPTQIPSGLSTSQNTVIKAENKGQATLRWTPGLALYANLAMIAVWSDHVTFQGFNIDAAGLGDALGVHAVGSNPSVDITVRDMELYGGVHVSNNSYGKVAINGFNNYTGVLIKDNKIHDWCNPRNPSLPASNLDPDGMYLTGSSMTIEGNDVSNVPSQGLQSWNSGPPNFPTNNNVIRNNYFHDIPGRVLVSSQTNSFVYNNVFARNGYGAGNVALEIGGYGQATSTIGVYNNTIIQAGGWCMHIGGGGGGSASNVTLKNNICWQNGNDGSGPVGGLGSGTGNVQDHNTTTNPQFASTTPGASNYLRLSQASTDQVNAGVTIAGIPSTDKTNNQRDAQWDIGAYEYGGSPPQPTDPLLAYWKCDEAPGSATAADSNPNPTKHPATMVAGATFGPPKIGAHACVCDGVDDVIQVANDLIATGASAVSLTLWGQLPDLNISGSELVSLGDVIALHLNPLTLVGIFSTDTGGQQGIIVDLLAPLTGSTWHHYALVVDPANKTETLYLDGIARTPHPGNGVAGGNLAWGGRGTDTMLCMHGGAGGGNPTKRMHGSLDEVKVWGRALTAGEVQKEYGLSANARHRMMGMR